MINETCFIGIPNRVGPLAASAGGAVDGAMMEVRWFEDGDSDHSSVASVLFRGTTSCFDR